MCRLADCCAKGIGISQNLKEATFWAQKAVSHDHPKGEKVLHKLESGRIR